MLGSSILSAGGITAGILLVWILAEGGLYLYHYMSDGNVQKRYAWIRENGAKTHGIIEECLRKYHDDKGKGYYTYHITYSFLAEDNQTYYGKVMVEDKELLQQEIIVYYNLEEPQENFTEYHIENAKMEDKYFHRVMGIVTAIFAILLISSLVFR